MIFFFYSDEKAKKHLERFLYEAQGLSSEVPHILNVCLLTVQCMEVRSYPPRDISVCVAF